MRGKKKEKKKKERKKRKTKCSHQLNKSHCSDNGANSIEQTTDIGIKRDGRLKISLNCHDNGHRVYTHRRLASRDATTTLRYGTPHATRVWRIIKRNYCRVIVNNNVVIKVVISVTVRGYDFASLLQIVSENWYL